MFWLYLMLPQYGKGPMALMEACMVRLPFSASSGKSSVLHTLVESSVPVQTFGSDTVKVSVVADTWVCDRWLLLQVCSACVVVMLDAPAKSSLPVETFGGDR